MVAPPKEAALRFQAGAFVPALRARLVEILHISSSAAKRLEDPIYSGMAAHRMMGAGGFKKERGWLMGKS